MKVFKISWVQHQYNSHLWKVSTPNVCTCRGASKAGKKVLHIDTADFYGSHWASHQLGFFVKWCKAHASGEGPLYSNAETYAAGEAELGPSNEYNIDLAPKVRLCCNVHDAASKLCPWHHLARFSLL